GTTDQLLTINAAINPNVPDFTVRLSVTYNEPPGQYALVRTSFNKNTDSGVYSCQVGLDEPPYPTFSVRSPDPPTSITTKIDGVDPDSVVWVEGQTKNVTCEAIGGSPTPTVTLIRDGTELVSGTGSVSRDIAQTRSMNPVVIQCEATNVAIDNPITDQTTINVLYSPSSGPDITGYTGQILTEGVPPTTVTVTCTVGEANPVPTLTWNCPAGSSGTGSNTRVISINRSMDGVTCTCSGSQSVTGWTGADSVTFTVHYGPDSVTIDGNKRVYTGEPLTLSCDNADSNPGVTYQWTKKGAVLTGQTQQTLTSSYSKDDNNAVIACTAVNSGTGTTSTGSVSLTVDYGPDRAEITGNTRVVAGTQMTLTCTATSYSPGVTYQWTKKGVNVGVTSGTYKFTPNATDDNAEVVCVAKNTQHLNKQTQQFVTLDILCKY
ncbi:hypothetical protein ScPMuIL_003181, partial [Solemya velum]